MRNSATCIDNWERRNRRRTSTHGPTTRSPVIPSPSGEWLPCWSQRGICPELSPNTKRSWRDPQRRILPRNSATSYRELGRTTDAARQYTLAEAGWRFDAPNPVLLARFMADHDRNLPDALSLAQRAAADWHDIFTEDALAWCYFKNGKLQDAASTIKEARRTGTKDQTILRHAAEIDRAMRAAED